MKWFLVFLVVIAFSVVSFGQTDSLSDSGVVEMVIQKPVDTQITFKQSSKLVRIRRVGGNTARMRIYGTALDTIFLREYFAKRYAITGTNDTIIVDSMDVLFKAVPLQIWNRIRRN